jgi:hypothetical protein
MNFYRRFNERLKWTGNQAQLLIRADQDQTLILACKTNSQRLSQSQYLLWCDNQ